MAIPSKPVESWDILYSSLKGAILGNIEAIGQASSNEGCAAIIPQSVIGDMAVDLFNLPEEEAAQCLHEMFTSQNQTKKAVDRLSQIQELLQNTLLEIAQLQSPGELDKKTRALEAEIALETQKHDELEKARKNCLDERNGFARGLKAAKSTRKATLNKNIAAKEKEIQSFNQSILESTKMIEAFTTSLRTCKLEKGLRENRYEDAQKKKASYENRIRELTSEIKAHLAKQSEIQAYLTQHFKDSAKKEETSNLSDTLEAELKEIGIQIIPHFV